MASKETRRVWSVDVQFPDKTIVNFLVRAPTIDTALAKAKALAKATAKARELKIPAVFSFHIPEVRFVGVLDD